MMRPITVAGIAVAAAAAGAAGSWLLVRPAVGPMPETVSGAFAEPAPAGAGTPPAPETRTETGRWRTPRPFLIT